MTDKERLKEISDLLERYYSTDDSFEQTDLAIEIIQGHVDWLIQQAERVEELEEGVKEAVSDIENISPHEAKKTLMNLIKNMEGEK